MKMNNRIFLLIIMSFVLLSCTTMKNNKKIGIANPASEYCIKKGGRLTIKRDSEGNEFGICKLKNGTEIEEWEYFRNNNQ